MVWDTTTTCTCTIMFMYFYRWKRIRLAYLIDSCRRHPPGARADRCYDCPRSLLPPLRVRVIFPLSGLPYNHSVFLRRWSPRPVSNGRQRSSRATVTANVKRFGELGGCVVCLSYCKTFTHCVTSGENITPALLHNGGWALTLTSVWALTFRRWRKRGDVRLLFHTIQNITFYSVISLMTCFIMRDNISFL